jgi:prepilin-type N-terminal cleavage/methylation domain-containing protein
MDDPDSYSGLLNSSRRRGDRRGFSLVEIVVAIVMVVLLLTVTIPLVITRLAEAHANAIVSEMQGFERGIQMFVGDVGRYPRRLDLLNTIVAGDFDACAVAIPTANLNRWRGPYINRSITLINGTVDTRFLLSTGDTVQSQLTRTTIATVGGTQQVLQILIAGPEQSIVTRVDSLVDGVADGTRGTIQYTTPLALQDNTIKWTFPIKNGAC